MAYPTVSAPYGLQAINSIDGKPYAGAFRQIPVAAAYATAIFNGDTVAIDSTGYLVKSTTTDSGAIVGVCVGGQYVNSSGQTVQGQYIPALASTSTNYAYAYVVDDPMALFKVAVVAVGTTTIATAGRTVVGTNYAYAYVVDDPMALFKVAVVAVGTTTIATAGRAVVGTNLPLVINAGSTTTGDSAFGVTTTGANTTSTIPIRVIDVVPATATGADAYTELLVKINTHQYNNTTGV